MGAWGISISSNDDYMDVYEEIMDQFNRGKSIETVIQKVVEEYENEFEGDENSIHNLCFAAAYASWECGLNDITLYNKIKKIIESGSDIKCWRELGASQQDLRKREKALLAFLTKLSTPKEKPKKPKQIKFKPALFEKGDVLSIQLEDGSYSGGIVLENIMDAEEYGSNFIVKAYMSNTEKPTISEILKSKIYDYSWYIGVQYKKNIKQIEKIGNLKIENKYDPSGVGTTHSSWANFVTSNRQNNYIIEKNNDIKNVEAFLYMLPEEIAKRQREKVKSYLKQALNPKS